MSAKENIGSITKKTPLEIAAYIEQINIRERRFASINKVFTLNVKRCKSQIDFS